MQPPACRGSAGGSVHPGSRGGAASLLSSRRRGRTRRARRRPRKDTPRKDTPRGSFGAVGPQTQPAAACGVHVPPPARGPRASPYRGVSLSSRSKSDRERTARGCWSSGAVPWARWSGCEDPLTGRGDACPGAPRGAPARRRGGVCLCTEGAGRLMPQRCLVQCGRWQIQNPHGRTPCRELVLQPEAGRVNACV